MRTRFVAASAAATLLTLLTSCSSAAAAEMVVGDCLRMGGTPDRPEAIRAACGTPESNFKVVAVVTGNDDVDECPTDVDSYYSMRSTFSESRTTYCMDVDWVLGGCMSVDPDNGRDPVRVDCADASLPGRQRATQILRGVANVDQCGSGVGYAYDQRNFTVCVDDLP